ncbi:AfsA-related hotdog domain-containing protein [Kitasatospora sp. NPDC002965]|uniref:AfsA-related hotdog domain-containing protein n=1 Tax=Kitasatospora sp. NPDC002965 TaxID=3154775 RepID=UPI0033AFE2C9
MPVLGASGSPVPLHVDEDDPCFFDHPLDHVPGMLLVAALLDLIRARMREQADAGFGRLRISLSFDRICERDRPVLLHCDPVPADDGPAWRLLADQDGETVCQAVAGLGRTAAPTGRRTATGTAGPDGDLPADAALVHRRLPENILLGTAVRTERAAVLVPSDGHRLQGDAEGLHTPDALIESARQMATMLGHTAHGRDPDAQMLWLSLEADVPTGLPTSVPLALHWEFTPARGARAAYPMVLVDAESGEPHGRIEIVVHSLDRARYERRRAAK